MCIITIVEKVRMQIVLADELFKKVEKEQGRLGFKKPQEAIRHILVKYLSD